jgi:hypothetical protein
VARRAAEETSPYSILRKSPQNDIQDSIASLEELHSHGGGKLTRAEILR